MSTSQGHRTPKRSFRDSGFPQTSPDSPKHSKRLSDESTRQSEITQKSYKSKMSYRLSDLMAAMYPGMKFGHKFCVPKTTMVPQTMGWLWNTEETAAGVPFPRGYRPGAIALGVKRKFSWPRSIAEPLTTPIGSKGKKAKGKKVKTTSSTIIESRTDSLASLKTEKRLPPTLHVRKEKGVYRVTMQPIKQHQETKGEAEKEEQPVKFQIAEDSNSSFSGTSRSSSTIKIEYICTGARRKPIEKPILTEIATQYETSDFEQKEPEKEEVIVEPQPEEKPKKKGKKGKKSSKE